jgi:ABC-type nitrate/sulfonate/bicarbonate transport system permease component
VTIVVGTHRRRPSESRVAHPGSVLPWGLLCALLAAWELAAYFQQPRADHPTLSSLADQVLDWRPAQALAFLAWIAVGADLSRR